MPLGTLTALGSSNSRRQKTIKVAATVVGNYVPVTGVPLDLTTVVDPNFLGSCFPGQVPQSIQIENAPDGYSGEIIAGTGTNLATAFALKIYTAPGVEMTAIAFPAALLADSFLLAMFGPNWGF